MEMGFVEGLCLRLVVLHCLELESSLVSLNRLSSALLRSTSLIPAIIFEARCQFDTSTEQKISEGIATITCLKAIEMHGVIYGSIQVHTFLIHRNSQCVVVKS